MSYNDYSEFNRKKEQCRECEIGKIYDKVVLSDGNTVNPLIMIIGECPGNDETIFGKPFVGKAGKLLRSTLLKYNITMDKCLITNTIPCRPLDNKFPQDENLVYTCRNKWLKEEIKLTSPRFILLVGATPLKYTMNLSGITKLRGTVYNKKFNGKTVTIIPTLHPSYVLRKMNMSDGQSVLDSFEEDIKKIAELAKILN